MFKSDAEAVDWWQNQYTKESELRKKAEAEVERLCVQLRDLKVIEFRHDAEIDYWVARAKSAEAELALMRIIKREGGE